MSDYYERMDKGMKEHHERASFMKNFELTMITSLLTSDKDQSIYSFIRIIHEELLFFSECLHFLGTDMPVGLWILPDLLPELVGHACHAKYMDFVRACLAYEVDVGT
jgi:hypothetical protein